MNKTLHQDYVEVALKDQEDSPEELQLALERAWKEVERIRKARMRRYAYSRGVHGNRDIFTFPLTHDVRQF